MTVCEFKDEMKKNPTDLIISHQKSKDRQFKFANIYKNFDLSIIFLVAIKPLSNLIWLIITEIS